MITGLSTPVSEGDIIFDEAKAVEAFYEAVANLNFRIESLLRADLHVSVKLEDRTVHIAKLGYLGKLVDIPQVRARVYKPLKGGDAW